MNCVAYGSWSYSRTPSLRIDAFELGIVPVDDRVIIFAGLLRGVDAAVVNVGNVLHVRDAVAEMRKIAPQHVKEKKRARVPEVRLRRRREAADVDANVTGAATARTPRPTARARVIELQSHYI